MRRKTRLLVIAVMATALFVTSCGQASSPSPSAKTGLTEAELYEAAKKEGTLTWWTAHYALPAAERQRDAFIAKYPGIKVDLSRKTAQQHFQALDRELRAQLKPSADVFDSTDEAHYVDLKKRGVLTQYKPSGLDMIPADLRKLDNADDYYQLGALGFVLINYNSDKISQANVPTQWKDLLDPKWKGQIALGHPGFSGYVGNWVLAMNDKYGWKYFEDLKKNNPKIAQSVNDTVTSIQQGERNLGAGPDNFSLETKAKGVPINIQYPTDDPIIIVSPTGILKDAQHPNAARLFENFRYSKEFNQALVKSFNLPLRTDVAPAAGAKGVKDVKYYRNRAARLENITAPGGMIEQWRTTFGV
jgi:iron(III) transport system substrate-binding protein